MARVAGTTRGFLQAVSKWTKQTEARSEAAFQNGLLDFYDALSAATPVLTGNLRNSLVASLNGGGAISTVTGPGNTPSDSTFRSGASQSIATIMSAKIGDRVSFRYGAVYAMRVNYGFTGVDAAGRMVSQPGRFWIESVGARWRSIMRNAATRLRNSTAI